MLRQMFTDPDITTYSTKSGIITMISPDVRITEHVLGVFSEQLIALGDVDSAENRESGEARAGWLGPRRFFGGAGGIRSMDRIVHEVPARRWSQVGSPCCAEQPAEQRIAASCVVLRTDLSFGLGVVWTT